MSLSMSPLARIRIASLQACALMGLWMLPAHGQVPSVARVIGTLTKIESDSITIKSDSNGDVKANLTSSTRLLRVAAGEKDLKNATVLTIRDLQSGDRVLVRGQPGPDDHTINALAVIVMKQADLSEKQKRQREDWQKRGIGGLVTEVDAAHGTITLSSGGLGKSREIVVHTTKDTILRRYSPNSTNFAEAKPAPLDQIKAGDQLLARGESSADGKSMTAEEVVSGTFRNIAGSVSGINSANQSLVVQDLIKKGEVEIKISADSQIKKIPAEIAQRVALRLKGDQANGNAGKPDSSSKAGEAAGRRLPSEGQGGHPGSAPDLQRLLGRLPNISLADLHQGDVVMVVSTTGADSGTVTAVTVLAGVEPILAAAPSRSASAALSAWTLGGPSMEGATEP
jgi:Domain of unknown function (DUF5666)